MTEPIGDEAVYRGDEARAVLHLLSRSHTHAIWHALAEPATVSDLEAATGVAQTNVTRMLNAYPSSDLDLGLVDCGLVAELDRRRLTDSHRRATVYQRQYDEYLVDASGDELTVTFLAERSIADDPTTPPQEVNRDV